MGVEKTEKDHMDRAEAQVPYLMNESISVSGEPTDVSSSLSTFTASGAPLVFKRPPLMANQNAQL